MQLLLMLAKDDFDEAVTPGEQLQDRGRALGFGDVRRSEFLPHDCVRLCALAGFAQPGDFLFQCLKPLLLAIDHIGQLLEHRQQFKLPRRQLVSCDIRRDEFLRDAHDLAT